MLASFLVASWYRNYIDDAVPLLDPSPPSFSLLKVAIGGILVGSGSSLGEGCTSGNGIQGLAAMSPASLTHVVVFMVAGSVTSTLLRPADSGSGSRVNSEGDIAADGQQVPYELLGVALCFILAQYAAGRSGARKVGAAFGGAAFATSLLLSSMPKQTRVLAFLDFSNGEIGWDPTLAFVMGGALLVAFPMYQMLGLAKSSDAIAEWVARPASKRTVLGGTLFGMGWGLVGICPGPGIVLVGAAISASNSVPTSLFSSAVVWTAAMLSSKALLDRSGRFAKVVKDDKAKENKEMQGVQELL